MRKLCTSACICVLLRASVNLSQFSMLRSVQELVCSWNGNVWHDMSLFGSFYVKFFFLTLNRSLTWLWSCLCCKNKNERGRKKDWNEWMVESMQCDHHPGSWHDRTAEAQPLGGAQRCYLNRKSRSTWVKSYARQILK